jgi:hypothetical protein
MKYMKLMAKRNYGNSNDNIRGGDNGVTVDDKRHS